MNDLAKSKCPHRHVLGDNYGQTCRDCGEVLAGVGFGDFFGRRIDPHQPCIHRFTPDPTDERDGRRWEICIFCEMSRPVDVAPVGIKSGLEYH